MKISVIIVTKNRKAKLIRCVESLRNQTYLPDELVLVDNCSTDGTREYVKAMAKTTPFVLHMHTEKRSGYPFIYNCGIQKSSFPWVVFIDDDCVASRTWLEETKKQILKHPQAAVILGNSLTLHKKNVFSLATLFSIYRWKQTSIQNSVVVDYEALDNKNIAYNRTFLMKHRLEYDESRAWWANGGAEDADLGMQIWKAKGKAFFAPKMTVFHEDPVSFSEYIRKLRASIAFMVSYEHKWEKEREEIQPTLPRNRLLPIFFTFQKEHQLSLSLTIRLSILLFIAYVYTRVRYRHTRKVFRSRIQNQGG